MENPTIPMQASRDDDEPEAPHLRNIAAKWIRLGINLYSIRPQMHQATPGILIQPVHTDDPDSQMNVIVLDETTDILITFETTAAAQALCAKIMEAVNPLSDTPENEIKFTGIVEPIAADILRAIERAVVSSRLAGTLSRDPDTQLKADGDAKMAENEAIRLVLKGFHGTQ